MALVRMRVRASRAVVGGRYRLGERLGDGAAGVVWRAWDTRLGRAVAIKQLAIPPGLAGADARRAHADAAREGRIAARLQHPAVAGMLDMVVEDGSSWLVMEHVAGRSLAEVLEHSTLRPLEAARVGAELADALAVAHAAGVVHSDVKPANVLLREDGTVKLADFGIARVIRGENLTGPGVLSGTPLFMAPEVARGQWPDGASDVYSLAGTLYAAVEGVGPFGPMDHDEPLAMIRRVAETSPLPPRRSGPLTAVLVALLADDPSARPSAAAARDLLREVVAPGTAPVIVAPSTARPLAPASPVVTRDRVCRTPRRSRALTALSAAGVVGVGAVAGSFGGGPVMSLLTSAAPAPFDRIAVLDGAASGQPDAPTAEPGLPVAGTDTVAAPAAPAPVAPAVPVAGAPIVVPDPGWSAARADTADAEDTADGDDVTDVAEEAGTDGGTDSGRSTSSRLTALPVEARVIEDVPVDGPGVGGVLSGVTSTVDDVVPVDLGASSDDGLVDDLPVRVPLDLGSDDGLLGLPVDVGSDDGLLGLPVDVDLPGGLLGGSSDDSRDSDDSDSDDSDSDHSSGSASGGAVGSVLSEVREPLSVLSFPGAGDEADESTDDSDDSSDDDLTGAVSSTLSSALG